MLRNEFLIKLLLKEIFALQVDNRTFLSLLVNHDNWRHTRFLCHECVVGTEVRSDMHNTRTVFGSNIITGNHTESAAGQRRYERKELLILHPDEFRTEITSHDFPRNNLVALIV